MSVVDLRADRTASNVLICRESHARDDSGFDHVNHQPSLDDVVFLRQHRGILPAITLDAIRRAHAQGRTLKDMLFGLMVPAPIPEPHSAIRRVASGAGAIAVEPESEDHWRNAMWEIRSDR